MSRYEQAIVDSENEKATLVKSMKLKDTDVAFIKQRYDEMSQLYHEENVEKQKL